MRATTSSQTIHPITRQSLKVILLAAICVAAFLFHIWFRTLVITQGFEVGRLQKNLQSIESQLALATVDRNQKLSARELDRLVKTFQDQGVDLGTPKKHQIVYLPKSSLKNQNERKR